MTISILNFLGISITLTDSTLDEIIDFENGSYLYVYVNTDEIVYHGTLSRIDGPNDKTNYLLLNEFEVYNYNGSQIETIDTENPKYVLIDLDSVSRIEIYYSEDSKTAEKLQT